MLYLFSEFVGIWLSSLPRLLSCRLFLIEMVSAKVFSAVKLLGNFFPICKILFFFDIFDLKKKIPTQLLAGFVSQLVRSASLLLCMICIFSLSY